ncbi:MAG TPA: hypothetical protein VF824_09110 [Thermoanaerobaculia bacterium]|jgi:hypothetical protein
MTEPIPDRERDASDPEPAVMPRWVPLLIGAILVLLAALAVFTGLRYREDAMGGGVVRQRSASRATAPAPPGEPGAGASLVLHGESGENRPSANEPVQGQSRAVITNGSAGVEAVVRVWARRGMIFNVLPDDATVYVNDLRIGEVSQFNTVDEVYEFAEPGSYTVRVVAPNGATRTFVVTAADDAKQDVARISVKL